MNTQVSKIVEVAGYEFWIHFDQTAGAYELFLDESGEFYLGIFDSIRDAKKYIPVWLSETSVDLESIELPANLYNH